MADVVLPSTDPLAIRLRDVIESGDVPALRALLAAQPTLIGARIDDGKARRSILHLCTDWPGRWPHVAQMIALIVEAGGDPNARCEGPHTETPLHWAASCNDVDAIDALIAAGADIEADGAVIGGLTPLADAAAFGQWAAARRLVDHGATVSFWQAAALGHVEQLRAEIEAMDTERRTHALWSACHAGQREAAELLLAHGADPHWVGHDELTPRAIAEREGLTEFVAWLDGAIA